VNYLKNIADHIAAKTNKIVLILHLKMEATFGHYDLKIPVDWVRKSEYDDSDDDGDAGKAHID
jgi:hypothetical protein